MRLNSKTRYATRALLELALHEPRSRSLRQVADSQALPAKYLEALFAALRQAGLVRSERGAQGGYRLANSSAEITLREIYDVFEGQAALVDCVVRPEECERAAECVTREVWCELEERLRQSLESVKLGDLAQRLRARQADRLPDYII